MTIECLANHECDFKESKDVLLTAESVEYDGQQHAAVVEGLDAFTGTDIHQQGEIMYSEDESVHPFVTDAPKAVGVYYAKVNIDFNDEANPAGFALNGQL